MSESNLKFNRRFAVYEQLSKKKNYEFEYHSKYKK